MHKKELPSLKMHVYAGFGSALYIQNLVSKYIQKSISNINSSRQEHLTTHASINSIFILLTEEYVMNDNT